MALSIEQLLGYWIAEAERMEGVAPHLVAIGTTLDALLRDELGVDADAEVAVGGCAVVRAESPADAVDLGGQLGDIAGEDRVSVYVGETSVTGYPVGYDPAMPVFYIPVPPNHVDTEVQVDLYSHLRWYGLMIDEAFAGALAADQQA